MTEIWAQSALWPGLALVATLLSVWLRVATVLSEIVAGHRGRTLFERWLIGSVARQLVAYAICSVTVVRQHASTEPH